MQRNLETESLQRRQRNRKKENHVPDHKTGHTKTGFLGTRTGQPTQGENCPSQGRRCYLLDRRLGAEILLLGREGAGNAIS